MIQRKDCPECLSMCGHLREMEAALKAIAQDSPCGQHHDAMAREALYRYDRPANVQPSAESSRGGRPANVQREHQSHCRKSQGFVCSCVKSPSISSPFVKTRCQKNSDHKRVGHAPDSMMCRIIGGTEIILCRSCFRGRNGAKLRHFNTWIGDLKLSGNKCHWCGTDEETLGRASA